MILRSTIHGRLLALGSTVALGLCALGTISVLERRAADRHLASISEANAALRQQLGADDLHDMIRGDVYGLLMTKSDSGGDRIREDLATHIALLRAALETERVARFYPELQPASQELARVLRLYATAGEEIAEQLKSDRLAAVTRLAGFLDLYQEARTQGAGFSSELERVVEETRLQKGRSLRLLSRLATGTSLSIALVTVLLTARLLGSIRRSLLGLREHVDRVAGGDLSPSDSEARNDELGQLRARLEHMTAAVRASVEEVGAALASVEGATESIGGVTRMVGDVTEQQLAGAAEASEAVRRIQSGVAGIGEASQELRATADRTAAAVGGLHETCGGLSDQAGALEGSVDESASSIRELTQSAGEVANRTDGLTRSTEDALAAVSAAVQAGEDVSGASDAARSLAERVIHTAEAGTLEVRGTLDGMQKILAAEQSTGEVVRQLGERAKEIGQIADVIDGVADETKLLSLNAAIISAQAGEGGRAFVVVATQIKELAERARTSTGQIRELVERVQIETSDAVETVEHSLAVVEREVTRSLEAGEALNEIGQAATENGERVAEISEATKRQQQLCDEARRHMEGVRCETSEIRAATAEQEGAAKGLLERCQITEEVGRAVSEVSRQQALKAGHLAEMAERGRAATANIDAALGEQGEACAQVVDLLDVIREKTRQSAEGLQEEVTGLLGENDALRRAFQKFRI